MVIWGHEGNVENIYRGLGLGFFICFKIKILRVQNNKTHFFYVLYSDKTWVFDQSERAQGPIYILILNKHQALLEHLNDSDLVYPSKFFNIVLAKTF